MSKMKKCILYVNSVFSQGSTGRIVNDLFSYSKKVGYDAYVIYGRGLNRLDHNKIKISSKLGFIFHIILTRLFDLNGFGSILDTLKIIRKIGIINPSLIHLHNLHGYYLNIRIFFNYLKKKNIPIIWTMHDCWPFTGHCAYYDFVNCHKWKKSCRKCPQKSTYPKSFLFDNSNYNYWAKKQLFNGLHNVLLVTPSNWLNRQLEHSFLKNYKRQVINNGIDLNIFRKKNVGKYLQNQYQGRFIILGVANKWEQRKGLDVFLQLSDLLSKQDICILIGLSKKQIARLPNNFVGIERTDSVDELVDYYSLADVFINPTLEDNFPTTNIEALACGLPIITFETGGSPEIVGDCGFIVRNNSINNIINYIELIKKMDRRVLAKRCRLRAETMYDKSKKYKDYIENYERLIGEGGNV